MTLRVYVNSRPVEAPDGGCVLDAVRALDPELATEVAAGARVVTDSRGLPVEAAAPVIVGSILRVVHAKTVGESPDAAT
ncbi:MAG: hypothetical protein U0132_03735 [Gemmatimonadaceae bacterium]